VDDYPAIKAHLERLKGEARGAKGGRAVARLVQWFQEGNFIFLGYLPYRSSGGEPTPRAAEGLGLFHPERVADPQHEALVAQAGRFLAKMGGERPFFRVEETNVLSRMHHRIRISILLVSSQPGEARSESAAVAGIFTDRSRRAEAWEIPVVEGKLEEVVQRHHIAPQSYKHKEVLDFFNGLPRFELFRLSERSLDRMLGFFLEVVDQPRAEVAVQPDEESDAVRILISVAATEVPGETQQRIRERVEALFNLTAQNVFLIRLSTFSILSLVFYYPAERRKQLPAAAQVEETVREQLVTREERLVRMWQGARGKQGADRLAHALVEGLSVEYKVGHSDAEILGDLTRLERMVRENGPQFSLRPLEEREGVKLGLFSWEKLSLSRLMPIFSNLQVLVEEEETYEVRLPERPAFLHTFVLQPPPGHTIEPGRHEAPLRDLIFHILTLRAEDNPLTALLLTAGFDWRQIGLMQLFRNYLMQVGTVYTKRTIGETLVRRPRATRALYGVFRARFDPELEGREAARREAESELEEAEREIDNLTEDRIVKGIANLIDASLRTNFYQSPDSPVIAIKLASAKIDQLPPPRPLYEIYVYAPLMEGIHLRGDKIARGGIRYSDRPDDFRTEVLGLMATQMKKNALIVPLGSKGGFVVKTLAPWEGNARAAGDDQYRVFIRALLSVTDNLAAGRPVPPPRVIRLDEDDPYLVVAADKGTAHLSDTANAVSEENGFWLGDAFASGGSNGYDHKAVGITARGAWESVKRLFWERGIDVQSEPVTVVGIGDMSGDVFGNGVLQSRTLKLVGAFDHRHVFLDPDPEPATAFAERERLFKLPRSAWSDYDPALLSEGGGVFPRSAKAIPVSPRLRALLDTEAESLSGEEMIRALLRMEVDLLWNGGIGTYLKSAAESHGRVGDPNNDAVRIDASQCRARVIGEGGNLGLTQAARVDLDLQGCGLHTDAIDNAGGVNMSDHEVNLKILLAALIEDGQLPDRAARNTVLMELEGAVTEAVLRANFRQVLVISMDRLRSQERVDPFVRLVDLLAAEGGLDRRAEDIPNTQRFQQFQSDGHGVPRPVLAVLLAYAKMLLYRRLVDGELMDEPFLERDYLAYFPAELRRRFELGRVVHPLRRQIIATGITNRVIDQAGMCFVPETAALVGKPWPEVVRAYLLADAVTGAPLLREQIYALATRLPMDEQNRLLMRLETLLAEIAGWLLLVPEAAPGGFAAEATLAVSFRDYCAALPGMMDEDEREVVAEQEEELQRLGVPPEAAHLWALLPRLRGFSRVCGLAGEGGLAIAEAYALSVAADERFRFSQLEEALALLRFTERMQKRFGNHLQRSLELLRRGMLRAIVAGRHEGTEAPAWVEAYLQQRGPAWRELEASLRQVTGQDQPDVVSLAVVIGQLEAL
jgi:glutamate dehydrogenase